MEVTPPYDAAYDHPERPCKWKYLFDKRADGCWTFDAMVYPDDNCGDCSWHLVYCEKEAPGNKKDNDYMILTANKYYKNVDLKGLCGNYDGDTPNDDDPLVCETAANFLHGTTIPEKCIDGDHQGND